MLLSLLFALSAFAGPNEDLAKKLDSILNSSGTKTYMGSKMSVDLKDAQITGFFSLLSSMTDLKIEADPDVAKKKITVSAGNQPWDKLLDDVLRKEGLKATVSGSTVKVHSVGKK